MKIIFFGQLGLSASMGTQKTTRERRIEMIGRQLVAAGHQVVVLGTKPYIDPYLTNLHGITLLPKISLRPGGWLYLVSSLFTVWRYQPEIIHIHTWRAATLLWLIALLSPEGTIVWTIDALPRRYDFAARLIARMARKICDVITVPTRTLQYRLLTEFAVPTYYIPDGYTPSVLKDLSLKSFKLRRNQYCLLLSTSPESTRQAMRGYTATKLRKKLVIASEATLPWQRLINRKAHINFIGAKTGRQLTTLVRHAACVMVTADYPHVETILQAMDAGQRIVAANTPLFQETIGLAGSYFRPHKITELRDALTTTLKPSLTLNSKAKKRAKNHFTWERIVPEYLALYRYRALALVPIDSVRPSPATDYSVIL